MGDDLSKERRITLTSCLGGEKEEEEEEEYDVCGCGYPNANAFIYIVCYNIV